MKAWVSRQYNGQYMLTAKRPILAPVEDAGHSDLYVAPGDPVGVRNLCDMLRKGLGLPFVKRGESIEVELSAKIT